MSIAVAPPVRLIKSDVIIQVESTYWNNRDFDNRTEAIAQVTEIPSGSLFRMGWLFTGETAIESARTEHWRLVEEYKTSGWRVLAPNEKVVSPKGLPKKLYYVKLKHGEGAKLRYAEKGGGKYTNKAHAIAARDNMLKRGVECILYETQELEWTEIED